VLLTPRYAALVLVALLLASAFVALSLWQYQRAQTTSTGSSPLDLAPIPLSNVILPLTPVPDGDVGRPVSISGHFDAGPQLLVPDRTPRGIPTGPDDRPVGVWVVAPLSIDGGTVVPVVRGWAPDAESAPTPPTGPVSITGRLYPSESSALRDPNVTTMPPGEVDIVSAAELVSLWSGDLIDGFVTVEQQSPASPELRPVRVPVQTTTHGLHWRNAVYAFQWFCFAAFALFFAARVVRDEAIRRRDPDPEAATPAPPPTTV